MTKETMTRNNMRDLARELKRLGVKEIIGHVISTDLDKHNLMCDLEDAVREIFIAKREKEFASWITDKDAAGVWDILAESYIASKKRAESAAKEIKERKYISEHSDMVEINEQAEKHHKDQVAKEVKEMVAKPKKPSVQPGTGGKSQRATKGTFYTWIEDRVVNQEYWTKPPTRANLLAEMAELFPSCKPKSLVTMLAGPKSWKWTKLDFLLSEDKDGLFSVGEKRSES